MLMVTIERFNVLGMGKCFEQTQKLNYLYASG